MKRLMAILTALSVAMPFANVKAEGDIITDCAVSSSCFVYQPGDEVNFYRNEDERKTNNRNAGITTIVLEDAGAGAQYVKVLAFAPYDTTRPYYESGEETTPGSLRIKDHKSVIDKIRENGTEKQIPWTSAKHGADGTYELNYITLDQLIKVFGAAKTADGNYTIDATKWGSKFMTLAEEGVVMEETTGKSSPIAKGFYTASYSEDKSKVWAVEYTLNAAKDAITAINVKQVASNTNTYAYLPVVSFDKTYDCHSTVASVDMGCYSCDDDYKWLQVGTQAETCTLVPNITSKGSCVKSVKTGVEDHILEFGVIALICGGALFIAKRKDLFKSI